MTFVKSCCHSHAGLVISCGALTVTSLYCHLTTFSGRQTPITSFCVITCQTLIAWGPSSRQRKVRLVRSLSLYFCIICIPFSMVPRCIVGVLVHPGIAWEKNRKEGGTWCMFLFYSYLFISVSCSLILNVCIRGAAVQHSLMAISRWTVVGCLPFISFCPFALFPNLCMYTCKSFSVHC